MPALSLSTKPSVTTRHVFTPSTVVQAHAGFVTALGSVRSTSEAQGSGGEPGLLPQSRFPTTPISFSHNNLLVACASTGNGSDPGASHAPALRFVRAAAARRARSRASFSLPKSSQAAVPSLCRTLSRSYNCIRLRKRPRGSAYAVSGLPKCALIMRLVQPRALSCSVVKQSSISGE